MKRTTVIGRWFLTMMMAVGISGTSNAFAAHESTRDAQLGGQHKEASREEKLLNFRIEGTVKRKSPSDCDVNKMVNEERKLDPQLPPSKRNHNRAAPDSNKCKETEPRIPMSR